MVEDLIHVHVFEDEVEEEDSLLAEKYLEVGVDFGDDLQPVVDFHVLVAKIEVDVQLNQLDQQSLQQQSHLPFRLRAIAKDVGVHAGEV